MQAQTLGRPDGLPLPQRYWAILTIALGVTMAVLDGAIANVALPAIARDLHASPAASIWVVNAYQLSITVSLLAFAALGDIVGYRRVYRAGLVVFTVTSGLCALSDSLATLTAARVLQGLGAAGVMSVNTALIRTIYPKAYLGRGLAINSFLVAFSSAAGPTLASAILSFASWPWLFAVNLPVGLVAALLAFRALPDNAHRAEQRFDVPSALLNAATFGLLIFAVDGFGHGQSPLVVGGLLAALLAVGTVFVRRQLRLAVPLLPIDLLRIPLFGLSICTSICSFTAQALALVSLPFFLQGMLGRSQVETGLLMTPWPLAIMFVAPFAGRLVEKYSPGLLGGLGLAMLAAGLALLATLPAAPDNVDIAWRMALCGAGFGLFQSPNNFALLSSAPAQRSGGASGMLGTARLIGQTGGAALVALLFNVFPANGSHVALLVAASCAAIAAAVSCLRIANTGVHAIAN